MKRCLVTGAAGFIGSHLAERLVSDGCEVIGIDSFDPYYDAQAKRANLLDLLREPRFRMVEADLNTADLRALLDGVEVVFHLAGQPGVRGSWGTRFETYIRNNVAATQRLLEAMSAAGTPKGVYASSSSVYGNAPLPMREDGPANPISPYGVTKLAAEHLCMLYARAAGVPMVAVRYFTVFGPRQRPDMAFNKFFRSIRAGEPIRILGDGRQTRDFTYVSDAVEGTVLAAGRGTPGEVYNLGGGCSATLRDTIATMERICGATVSIVFDAAQQGDVNDTLADTTKARRELGYEAKVTLERGLAAQAEHAGCIAKKSLPSTHMRHNAPRPIRVAIYSHDTFGLGHLRRNLAITETLLRRSRRYEVVLMTGSPVASWWPRPFGLKVEPLPPVVKIGPERYASRDGFEDFETVKSRREARIKEVVTRFEPDVVLVDHAPRGMKGELLATLEHVRREMPRTRLILGLRDIIDDAQVVRDLWREEQTYDLLDSVYDRILVYGSQNVFDAVREYGMSDVAAAKTRFCGYVSRVDPFGTSQLRASSPGTDRKLRVLVTAGGGGDGYALIADYLRVIDSIPSDRLANTIVTGPLMCAREADALHDVAKSRRNVHLVRSTTDLAAMIDAADLVVAMGGYNTVTEILAARKPAVLVPRLAPRAEQRMRSERLADLGLVWTVSSEAERPQHLRNLIVAACGGAIPGRLRSAELDFSGACAVGAAIEGLLEEAASVAS